MSFIVVSYYTKNTPYQTEAEKLKKSCIKYGIPYNIEETPNLRSWQRNTHYKAVFIKTMFAKFEDKNLVYTDADSIFHAYPVLFDSLDCDIAVHLRNWKHVRNELLSGTVYFKNCIKINKLVNEWIVMNRKNQGEWEQRNLQRIIRRNQHDLNIYHLPIEYCCIFDDDKRSQVNPVVEHFQKSRKYRRLIK